MRILDLRLSFLLGLLVLGCGRVHLGDHDSGPNASDGGSPVVCGETVCQPGQICCDETCGICGSADACPAIVCIPHCTSDIECAPGQYCAFQEGTCGPVGMSAGTCTPRSEVCPPVIAEVCGCDGRTYSSLCDAAALGVSVLHDGPCESSPCPPQDARGDGPCAAILGVAWNGERCESIGGCTCIGADCGAIFQTLSECESAYLGCAGCAPQDVLVEGDCELAWGYSWTGTSCHYWNMGCSCSGADCGALYQDEEACIAAHAHCAPGGPCGSSEDCAAGEYCHYPPGACEVGGLGECAPIPGELPCPPGARPVCGCDGVTYACEDQAYQSGQVVRHVEACTVDACGAMDAIGFGDCAAEFGMRWNGTACETVGGCECIGAACMSLFDSEQSCLDAYAACMLPPGGSCGGTGSCRPDEWCDFADPHVCGADGTSGVCVPRPTDCTTEDAPACACDGVVYSNACYANAAGSDTYVDPVTCGG
jgi:hypothetical protein